MSSLVDLFDAVAGHCGSLNGICDFDGIAFSCDLVVGHVLL